MNRDQNPEFATEAAEVQADKYTRGMAAADGSDAESTPELDKFQFGLFEGYLGERILEIGAGGGRFTAQVLAARPTASVVVAEPSPHFFAVLERRFGTEDRVTLLKSEVGRVAEQYPGHFDTVFAVDVMEHVEDDRDFLSKSIECTRPGGRVIMLVPAFQFLYSKLDENIGHFRRYDRKMIRQLLVGLDVTVEQMFYSNLLGFFGSLYFSKLRGMNYQSSDNSKREFLKIYQFFSKHVIPVVSAMERTWLRAPFGLNLAVILKKPASSI